MQARYENWANGLNGDWCVSRQRFFGVPFPVWYPIDARRPRPARPADRRPREDQLPIDPSTDVPRRLSRRAARRARRLRRRSRRHGHLGHLVADAADRLRLGRRSGSVRADVSRWTCGRRRTTSSARGCSTRSCARTSSTTRCRGRTRRSPAGCSTPIARRCRSRRATSSRRWRCSRSTARTACATGRRAAGPGTDTAFDPNQMKVGRRLAIKLLNASKFALGAAEPQGADHLARRSRDAANLAALVTEATDAFEGYDYARVLQRTETFFWRFCDDYLELVKGRRYGEQGAEARRVGQRGADRGALGAAAPVRAVSAVCHRRSLVVVAGRDRFTRRRGRRRRSSSRCSPDNSDGARGRPIRRPTSGRPTCCSRSASSARKPSSR